MPGPADHGVLIYALNLDTLSRFYAQLLGLAQLHAEDDHRVLGAGGVQLLVHAIPAEVARGIVVTQPPEPREDQAFKPFFTVDRLAEAEARVAALGGLLLGPVWDGPGIRYRNACDPEGNIVQLREVVAIA